MIKVRFLIFVLVTIFLTVGPAFAQSKIDARKEIEIIYRNYNDAIIAKDIDKVSALYDYNFTLEGGTLDNIMDRILAGTLWRRTFDELSYTASRITVEKAQLTPEGYISAQIKWEYKATKKKDNQETKIEAVETATDLWIKRSDGWKFYDHKNTTGKREIDGDEFVKKINTTYEQFNAAILTKNIEAINASYDNQFTLQTGGDVLDKDDVMGIWKFQFKINDYIISKITVQSAVLNKKGDVTANTKWEYKATQVDNDNKKVSLEISNTAIDVWKKNSAGQWKIFSHESTGSEGKINGKSLKGN